VKLPTVEEGLSVRTLRPLLLFPLVLAAAVLPGSGHAADPVLMARVGPGFSISIANAAGVKVSRVPAGSYSIQVRDLSPDHSFHLTGKGVDMATDVGAIQNVTWTVTLVDGTYSFICDAHPGQMKGTLKVGAAPPSAPKLAGKVGPGKTISLKTAAGAAVKKLAAGTYKLTVQDSTQADNFHVLGPGANKKTGVKFRGKVTWTVAFRAGKTYTVRSDPTAKLRKSFKVNP
jgi:hypothetical protein